MHKPKIVGQKVAASGGGLPGPACLDHPAQFPAAGGRPSHLAEVASELRMMASALLEHYRRSIGSHSGLPSDRPYARGADVGEG